MFEATESSEATTNDPFELDEITSTQESSGTIDGWSVPALCVGLALIATAVSGLLNELPATEHPQWIVPAAGVFGMCLAIAVRSVLSLLSSQS